MDNAKGAEPARAFGGSGLMRVVSLMLMRR